MKKIKWRTINACSGRYKISSAGEIRRKNIVIKRVDGTPVKLPERAMKISKSHRGYMVVTLTDTKAEKQFFVHRLLAMAFIPNPQKKPHINHINGNKIDNRLANLEWCTPKENEEHAKINGLKISGDRHYRSKITEKDALNIVQLSKLGFKIYEIIKKLSIPRGVISRVLSGRSWARVTNQSRET